MNGIGEAAAEVEAAIQRLGLPYCIIGGLAVVYWGVPRATQDVDISLWVGLGRERKVAAQLLEQFESRFPDAVEFAVESRMLLLRASNGTPIDIALAAFPLEERIIERSSVCRLQPGLALRLISAEDLIISKAIAGRPRDWDDIRGIIDRRLAVFER